MKNGSLIEGGREYPYISIMMGLFTAGIFLLDRAGQLLQYDRAAMANHEIWRAITGHWVHWSFEHFLWCTVVFVTLGAICETFNRKGFLATLAATTILIPLSAWFIQPEMATYRGLSGMGSGLFVFGAVLMMRMKLEEKEWPGFILALLAFLAFAAKIAYEYFYGRALFVNEAEIFSPVPLVHMIGGAVGFIMILIFGMNNDAADI